jgi:hypothetical protein
MQADACFPIRRMKMSTPQTTPQNVKNPVPPQKQPTDKMSSGSCSTTGNKEKSGGCGCG